MNKVCILQGWLLLFFFFAYVCLLELQIISGYLISHNTNTTDKSYTLPVRTVPLAQQLHSPKYQ